MDESSFVDKVSRLSRVGSTMGGLALRVAGEKFLGREMDAQNYAPHLKNALGNLKGPMMKVAQFLATIPGALPEEYSKEFLELQSNAPPMSLPFVKRRMASELGPNWQRNFAQFECAAAHAASLGQVHKARLMDGRIVACKLQYPQMDMAIESDLQNLSAFLGLYHTFQKGLDTQHIQSEIRARLHEELNYTLEAENMTQYADILSVYDFVDVPSVMRELSTSRLLTMSWTSGESLLDHMPESQEERNEIARRLFHIWYMPFYRHGVIHGDPHPGNYKLLEDNRIGLLDFGCIRRFPPSFIKGVLELYRALQTDDTARAVAAYESWGFTGLSNAHIEIMNIWARLLYEPLLDNRIRPIQHEHNGVHGWETAQKVHQELKRLGGITPPQEFVFMDRAAVGLGAVFMRLKAELNWHQLFEEIAFS